MRKHTPRKEQVDLWVDDYVDNGSDSPVMPVSLSMRELGDCSMVGGEAVKTYLYIKWRLAQGFSKCGHDPSYIAVDTIASFNGSSYVAVFKYLKELESMHMIERKTLYTPEGKRGTPKFSLGKGFHP